MITFWIFWTLMFAFAWWVSAVNARQHKALDILIPFMQKKLKPLMLEFNCDGEAREISNVVIPHCRKFLDFTSLYGTLILIFQVAAIAFAAKTSLSHDFPYILMVVSTMLFATVVVMTPNMVQQGVQVWYTEEIIYFAYIELQSLKEERDNSNGKESSGATPNS